MTNYEPPETVEQARDQTEIDKMNPDRLLPLRNNHKSGKMVGFGRECFRAGVQRAKELLWGSQRTTTLVVQRPQEIDYFAKVIIETPASLQVVVEKEIRA